MASMVATLGPIPLGLGTFEAGCVGMLSLLGVAIETALAATILLRGLTFWLPMVSPVFGSQDWSFDTVEFSRRIPLGLT